MTWITKLQSYNFVLINLEFGSYLLEIQVNINSPSYVIEARVDIVFALCLKALLLFHIGFKLCLQNLPIRVVDTLEAASRDA